MPFFLVATIPRPTEAVTCQTFWPVVSSVTALLNETCPNKAYQGTKAKTCEMGYGCCDGKNHTESEQKIQDCTKFAIWLEICATCVL